MAQQIIRHEEFFEVGPPAASCAQGLREPAVALSRCSSPAARALIPYRLARQLQVLPLTVSPGASPLLIAAVAGIPDAETIQRVRFASGYDVQLERVEVSVLLDALELAYQGHEGELASAIQCVEGLEEGNKLGAAAQRGDEKQVPALVAAMVKRAAYLGASDIHIEPGMSGTILRFRVDGELVHGPAERLSQRSAAALLRYLKLKARLDTTVADRPQEGGFTVEGGAAGWRVRLSTLPVLCGEKSVLRLVRGANCQEDERYPYGALGMLPVQQSLMLECEQSNEGLVLVSGPTGSGKTTLLYTFLRRVAMESKNVVTVEDPVEQVLSGINQVDLTVIRGMAHSDMLRFLLRQDPDVIMAGEIRRSEDTHLAMHAALTGHLVLTTLHAANCFEVLLRLAELGVSPLMMASALRLVVAQRLVPRNCPGCAVTRSPSAALQDALSLTRADLIRVGEGCPHCDYTGVSGRLGVFELLPIRGVLRSLLAESQSLRDLLQTKASLQNALKAAGYQPLLASLRHHVLSGIAHPYKSLSSLGISSVS